MDILLHIGQFILSLAVLLKAADYFIDSAEEIGLSLGISPFIIGVTIALLFVFGIVIFLVYSLKSGDDKDENFGPKPSIKTYLILIAGGIGVWLGADYTIDAIKFLSKGIGISPDIIALSAVALGTSLPEVIVSLNAARKGKTSIAVGNVIGSNIFNTYIVMSIPSFFGTLEIPENIISFSLPMMIVMTILFALMSLSRNISRWEGFVLLMFYAFFLIELFKSKV